MAPLAKTVKYCHIFDYFQGMKLKIGTQIIHSIDPKHFNFGTMISPYDVIMTSYSVKQTYSRI